jgi:hypothetical protein
MSTPSWNALDQLSAISGGRLLTDDDIGAIIHRALALWDRCGYGPRARVRRSSSAGRTPLARIISVTAAGHRASRRVMEKCGLTFQAEVMFRTAQVVWYAIDRPCKP